MTSKQSADGLTNVYTGLGGSRSKLANNVWQFNLLNDFRQLEAAYVTNWIAAAIVDNPAQDATREWRTIKSDGAEEIAMVEQELDVQGKTREAYTWSRLYGGAAILMNTGQDFEKPLNINNVKRGDLKNLIVFDRRDIFMSSLNTFNILAENYLRPEFYTIRGGSQRIHWTHFALFHGAPLPRRWMEHTQGWGDSYLRRSIEDVTDVVAAKMGVSELLQEANLDVISREGLDDQLASDEDDAIIKRYKLFSLMKSNINMALLDSTETLDRHTLNLTGVSQTMEQLITWVSGAARQPVVRLFGTSAKGMNATGEGDMHIYYDNLKSDQISHLNKPLKIIDEVMVRSALGKWTDTFDYVWNPLKQMNTLELSQERQLDSQRHRSYLEDGIVTKSQVMRELQSNEIYQFDKEQINKLEELEEIDMFNDIPEPDENSKYLERWRELSSEGMRPDEITTALSAEFESN